jgi:hypothetical protein
MSLVALGRDKEREASQGGVIYRRERERNGEA